MHVLATSLDLNVFTSSSVYMVFSVNPFMPSEHSLYCKSGQEPSFILSSYINQYYDKIKCPICWTIFVVPAQAIRYDIGNMWPNDFLSSAFSKKSEGGIVFGFSWCVVPSWYRYLVSATPTELGRSL